MSLRRAVVIDDDPECRRGVGELLAVAGYRVTEATGGWSGLTRIREDLPHLVITDIDMPEMDGVGLASAVRADPMLDRVVLVALTGVGLSAAEASCFDLMLTKPLDTDVFLKLVEELDQTGSAPA
jgi:two-component system chemotaxis response regulator CheY